MCKKNSIILNKNIHLSEGNIKSKNTDEILFLTWSLPCRITCPYRTDMCEKRCFAKKNENFEGVIKSRYKNLEESKKDSFVSDMIDIFNYQLNRKKTADKKIFVRIHTSGDFYNLDYFIKWVNIAEYFKGNNKILFQSYTKSMPIIEEYLNSTNNKDLNNVNIHFVWSIWDDTKEEYTKKAKELGLQTFSAVPKNKLDELSKTNEYFICNGDCGNCRMCYTGTKNVVIKYH